MDAIQLFPTVTQQECTISFFSVVVAKILCGCLVAGHQNGLAGTGVDEVYLYPSSNSIPHLHSIAIFVVRFKIVHKIYLTDA
jgi:hypothetical protein